MLLFQLCGFQKWVFVYDWLITSLRITLYVVNGSAVKYRKKIFLFIADSQTNTIFYFFLKKNFVLLVTFWWFWEYIDELRFLSTKTNQVRLIDGFVVTWEKSPVNSVDRAFEFWLSAKPGKHAQRHIFLKLVGDVKFSKFQIWRLLKVGVHQIFCNNWRQP